MPRRGHDYPWANLHGRFQLGFVARLVGPLGHDAESAKNCEVLSVGSRRPRSGTLRVGLTNMADQAPASDAELIESIQNGIARAGDGLFEKYASRVYYLALRELRSHADADDVRAETFLRVLKSIQERSVRSSGSLGPFILGTARNVILETLRSPDRKAHGSELPEIASPELDQQPDLDVRRAISATIDRLKPREREFLRLHYFEELPKDEIARRIGIDAERVRLLKHRSLKNFREIYQRLKKIADTKGGKSSHQC